MERESKQVEGIYRNLYEDEEIEKNLVQEREEKERKNSWLQCGVGNLSSVRGLRDS